LDQRSFFEVEENKFRTKLRQHFFSEKLLGRPEPPFRTGLCFTGDVSFYLPSSFVVSPLVLRAPSTDHPETLPHGRNMAEFYNRDFFQSTPREAGVTAKKSPKIFHDF